MEKKKAGEAKKQSKQGRGGKLRTGDVKVTNARGDVDKSMAGSNTPSLRSLTEKPPQQACLSGGDFIIRNLFISNCDCIWRKS